MSQKHFLLKGTFILTATGILTRVIFPCRRNRSVSADFPCLHTYLCRSFSRDRDGSGAPGCRLFCKKAVRKSLFLPESSTALFSFSFHLLSFSVAEKCCFSRHSHTWRSSLCLSHLPDSICTSIRSSAQLQLWLLSGAQADPASCPLPII